MDKKVSAQFTLRNGWVVQINNLSQESYQEILTLIESQSEEFVMMGELHEVRAKNIMRAERLS